MIGLYAILALAGLTAGTMNRRRLSRRIEDEYAQRFVHDANGIAVGAEGFHLAGRSGRALLLLHGSGDSPQSLRYIGAELHAAGYTVDAPLLPGHGRSPAAFAAATADDYFTTAAESLAQLSATHPWVAIIGLSMGGAIGARLAAESRSVKALVLLVPYLIPPTGVRRIAATSWLWGLVTPYLEGRGASSVHDSAASTASRAYGSFSAGALKALVTTADIGTRVLPSLTIPTLVINSESDNRIPRTLAQRAIDRIGGPVEVRWVSGCGHVVTVDYCKDVVAREVVAFLARHAG